MDDQFSFIPISRGYPNEAGLRLAVDRVTTAQEPHHQSTDILDSDYVSHDIQYLFPDEHGA